MVQKRMMRTLACLVTGAAVTLAACGGDDDSDDSADTSEAPTTEAPTTEAPTTEAPTTEAPTTEAPTTEAPTTEAPTTEAPTTEAPTPPTGDPILVSVYANLEGPGATPDLLSGAQAAASAVNDAGGIADPAGGDSRPIEILHCAALNLTDPNAPSNCAREAIDTEVIASVGKLSNSDDASTPLMEAGIPLIGPYVSGQADMAGELSFPLNGGAIAGGAGLAAALQGQGAKTVGLLAPDGGAADLIAGAMGQLLEGGPDDLVATIKIPSDPSLDLAAFLAPVVSANPDAIAVFAVSVDAAAQIRALRQSGYEGLIGLTSTSLTPEVVEMLGDMAEGLVVVNNYASPDGDDPLMAIFNAEMDQYAPDSARTEVAINAWMAMHVFADALSEAEAIDSPSLIEEVDGYVVTGIGPDFTLGVAGFDPLPLPRVPRATIQVQLLQSGKLIPVGDGSFIDLNTLVG